MNNLLDAYKGIAPGKVIFHELKRKKISQREFSSVICEHYQTINAIITGKRRLTLEQALKIEKELGFDEGFLLILQTYHDIKLHNQFKKLNGTYPKRPPEIRNILFWDIDRTKMDWQKHKKFIIERVSQRGNETEKRAIEKFYNIKL